MELFFPDGFVCAKIVLTKTILNSKKMSHKNCITDFTVTETRPLQMMYAHPLPPP